MTSTHNLPETAHALEAGPEGGESSAVRSLRGDAWRELKGRPLFWLSAAIISVLVLMALFPGLFTNTDPRQVFLGRSRELPNADAWFGRDVQSYDIYSRVIYGARASILVGVLASLFTALVGSLLGLVAGFAGGWVDTLLSRIAEVFFAIPLLLGAIIALTVFREMVDGYFMMVGLVVAILVTFGWPSIFRLMRSSVLQVKPNDYVQAARALGASPLRITMNHILPNALGPVIVVTTINLGVFIAVEAALSFLGIGLQPPTVSWGLMISDARSAVRTTPHVLLFPAAMLSVAVLGFIMLGDAVRDAFDPKSR